MFLHMAEKWEITPKPNNREFVRQTMQSVSVKTSMQKTNDGMGKHTLATNQQWVPRDAIF